MKKTGWKKAGCQAVNIIIIVCQIIAVVWVVENFGWLGFTLSMVLLALIMITRKWKQFMIGKKHIETMIWGKPLERMYWKDGELKNFKMKFRLNGKPKTKAADN